MTISLPDLTLDDLFNDEEFFKGLREGGFVLVLGTGFSYGVKNRSSECPTIPLAKDFAEYTARRFGTAVLDYSGAAQQWTNAVNTDADVFREFIDIFLVDEDEFDYKLYSSIFLPGWHNIFTFNFDNVLETVKSKTLNKKYPVRFYPKNTSASNVPNIIHLHGLLNEESEIEDIVFTRSSYTTLQNKRNDLYDVLHGNINDQGKGLIIIGTQFNEQIVFNKFFDGLTRSDIDIYHFDIANDAVRYEPNFNSRNYHFIKLEDKNGDTGTPVFLDFLHSHRDKIKNIRLDGAETINRTFIDRINSGQIFSRSKFYSAKQADDCQWYGILNNFDVERKVHAAIKGKVFNSFSSLGAGKVAVVVSGTGGCGKSTLLRRLAIEACTKTDFNVIWVKDRQLEQFVESGLPAIQADFDNKYLVFIEDWYRLAGDSKQSANNLLKTSQAISNIRLVIGDRDTRGEDYNENLIDPLNIFEIGADENLEIIQKILNGHPEWREAGDEVLKKDDALKASLFIILFVLAGIAEGRLEESEIDFSDFENAARSTAKSDLKKISAQYPGFALALHYWACVYASYKIHITWETLLAIADHFNGNHEISLYFADWKLKSDVLEKIRLYINVSPNKNLSVRFQNLDLVQFNHDKLAEAVLSEIELTGWAGYDDLIKKKLLNLIVDRADDFSASVFLWTFLQFEPQLFRNAVEKKAYIDTLFFDKKNRNFKYMGVLPQLELGASGFFEYMDVLQKENLYPKGLWSSYLKMGSKEEKKKGISAILSQEEFYKLPFEIVSIAMSLSKDETEKGNAASAILSQEEFYKLPDALVSTAMKISKNEKEKARAASAILSRDEFYKLPFEIVSTAMKISKNEKEKADAASAILSQEEFYKLPFEIVSTAMNISRDDVEKKNAASAILSQDEFYKLPHQITSTAMKISKDEKERADAASAVLSQDEFYKLPYQVVSTALKISKDETEKKDAASAILSQDEFYKLPNSIVTTAMNISRNDAIGKKAASAILSDDKFYELPKEIVSTAMRISDDEDLRLSRATHYLRNWRTENWGVVFRSLYCFSSVEKIPDFVTDIVDTIIRENNAPGVKAKGMFPLYINLMKIPFHDVPSWVKASRIIIRGWKYKPRSLVVSTLLSHLSHPDEIEEMCEDILLDWEKELAEEILQPYGILHFGDHIRIAMGHPDMIPHALKAARQMVERSKSKPGPIPDYLLDIAGKIVEKGEYPLWDNSE